MNPLDGKITKRKPFLFQSGHYIPLLRHVEAHANMLRDERIFLISACMIDRSWGNDPFVVADTAPAVCFNYFFPKICG